VANYKCQCYRNIQRERTPWGNRYVVVYAWEWERGRKVCLFCGKRLPVYCLARDWPEPIYDDRRESSQGAR